MLPVWFGVSLVDKLQEAPRRAPAAMKNRVKLHARKVAFRCKHCTKDEFAMEGELSTETTEMVVRKPKRRRRKNRRRLPSWVLPGFNPVDETGNPDWVDFDSDASRGSLNAQIRTHHLLRSPSPVLTVVRQLLRDGEEVDSFFVRPLRGELHGD